MVYRLVGDFDPHEAITHGYIDSQQLPAWRTTDASLADFNGSPSSIIEGTYRAERDDAQHLATPRDRHLRARQLPGVAGGDDRGRRQVVAEAQATDGIVNGFRAGPPGSNQPAPPPPAAAPPAAPPAVGAPPPQARRGAARSGRAASGTGH